MTNVTTSLFLAASLAFAAAAVAEEAPSLYGLSADLVDQQNRDVTLDVHRGHPTIVSMFYATCPHACPALISDIKRIDASLDDSQRASVRHLLVSLDPDDETETFRRLMEMHGLDPERWRLTKTDAGTVRRLAAALGIKYRRLPDGSWNHSSVVTVLDGDGRIVDAVEGLGLEHEDTIATLAALADESAEGASARAHREERP